MSKISLGTIALTIAVVAASAVSPHGGQHTARTAAVTSSDWSTVLPLLQRNTSVLTSPPTQTPGVNVTSDKLNIPDGPFMGNGDVTVAVGGTAASQTYTMTTTDFWNGTFPAVVGSMTVNTPGFDSSASYRQEQDPGLAEVRSTFSEGAQGLKIRALTAATANTMVVQLTNSGSTAINGMTLATKAGSVGTNFSLPITDGVDASHGTAWVTRTTDVSGNPWVARDALVTRVVDGTSSVAVSSSSSVTNALSLPAGATVNVVVAVGGGHNSTSYLTDAQNSANAQTDSSIASLVTAHQAWWKSFWTSGATVDVGGGPVEQYWYSSLYMLASANRTGQEMPGMQNIQTEDHNLWDGGWWTNYDIENPYLGVYSANHPELTDSYDAGINQFLSAAYRYAGDASGAKGVAVPTTIAAGGQTRNSTDYGMKGDAAFLATVFVNHWNYTRDASWAPTVYPWMLGTAHYWDQRLVKDANGVYNVQGSAQNEGSKYILNPTGDLSYLRGLYAALIDMNAAGAVNSSASDLALWKTELANLAPLPTFTTNGRTDLKATQDAPGFYGGDANPVNGATFAPVLGLGSPAATLQALRNTIYDLGDNANIWYQGNSFAWIYPAAARAGLPDIFDRMAATLGGRPGKPTQMRANGTVVQGGGGAETLGSVETVDQMLLSSYDGVLRFFPAWTYGRAASFSNMGAVGGFSVSSSMTASGLQASSVVSKKGQPLVVAQAWPGATTSIADTAGGSPVTGSAATLTASTVAGHTYTVTFSGGVAPKVDLAPAAKASASSDLNTTDWWSGYANDGQTTSQPSTLGWTSSANVGADHQEYYQLDFGKASAFSEVDLSPRSDAGNVGQGFPSSYSVAVSNDGSTWTTVATGSTTSAPTSTVAVAFPAQSARYLRVTGLHLTANPNDQNQYRMQLAEVGVFATSALPVGSALHLTSQKASALLQGTANLYPGSTTAYNVAARTTPQNSEMSWNVTDAGGGYLKIANVPDHLVLTGTADGYQGRTDVMNVEQAPDAAADTQLWKPIPRSGGFYQLVNKASGLALWATGDSYVGTANTFTVVAAPASWAGTEGVWSIAP